MFLQKQWYKPAALLWKRVPAVTGKWHCASCCCGSQSIWSSQYHCQLEKSSKRDRGIKWINLNTFHVLQEDETVKHIPKQTNSHVAEVVLLLSWASWACWSASVSSGSNMPIGSHTVGTEPRGTWTCIVWATPLCMAEVTVRSLRHFINATLSRIDLPTIFASLSWNKPDSTWQSEWKRAKIT